MTTVTQVKLDLACRLLFAADSLGKTLVFIRLI
jgi:hypothetical protein